MRDIFSEGLLYLDLLEIYGSSYAVSELCGVAQSNVFRGANACSKLLNLGLSKDRSAGVYRIERNQDVQRDLRRLNQRLRARENGQLRLVSPLHALPAGLTMQQASLLRALPCRWPEASRSLDYLERGLLDLLVLPSWMVSQEFPWPPPVRRTDLFVPIPPFVVTELSPLALGVLSLRDHHCLGADQASAPPAHGCPLAVATGLGLTQKQLAGLPLPLARSKVTPIDLGEEALQSWFEEHSDGLVLMDQLSLQHVLDSYPHQPWSPWRCELPVNGALLLISLPSLVPEPLHQQLTTILRNHAAQASQRCLRALGSAQAHGLA